MIQLSAKAERDLGLLLQHYARRDRPEAAKNLILAIDNAVARIEVAPHAGLAAPRPYPHLAHSGEAWIKSGRYWITYSLAEPPVILGVFFETADIPGRSVNP